MRDLPRIVAESPIGQPLSTKVLRDGKMIDLVLTLQRSEDEIAKAGRQEGGRQDGGRAEDGRRRGRDGARRRAGRRGNRAGCGQGSGQASRYGRSRPVAGNLDDEGRKTWGIAKDVEGVVITDVAASSAAAEKGLARAMSLSRSPRNSSHAG